MSFASQSQLIILLANKGEITLVLQFTLIRTLLFFRLTSILNRYWIEKKEKLLELKHLT